MKQANLTDLRRNLSAIMTRVNTDHEPLVVTRRRGKPVVMISLEDYQAMGALARPGALAPSTEQALQSLIETDDIHFVPNARKSPFYTGND